MYRVIHLQNSTESAGGAALRLHKAFLEADIDSKIISLHPNVNDSEKIIPVGGISRYISRLEDKIQSLLSRHNNKEFGLFSYTIFGTNISNIKEVKEADVIYIHWVQYGFLNIRSIRELAKLGKPVIFFMHDMYNITGGCHYSFQCDKYTSFCHECQVFRKANRRDWSTFLFIRKRRLYNNHSNLYFVTPSNWLLECARKSTLTKNKPLFMIPNLLDKKIFKPTDKKNARHILDLDEKGIIILFGAVSISSPYKGISYLIKALEVLRLDQDMEETSILIFGSGYNKELANAIPFRTKFIGYLRDEYSTSVVFNAADVFIAPSLAEAFGYVVLESLCCGTPVTAFNTGGISDLIDHKKNGYLAKYKDADDLAVGIRYCLKNKIVGKDLPSFDNGTIVDKHIQLINSIITK